MFNFYMDETKKREMIRNYFRDIPKQYHWSFNIGILLLAALFLVHDYRVWIFATALILILIGSGFTLIRKRNTATDEQMDQWLKEDIENLIERSVSKLKIDPEKITVDPIALKGPIVWYSDGVPYDDLLHKVGKDGRPRFGVYHIMLIIFCDVHTDIYEYTHNFLQNIQPNERTYEFYKQEIVKVSIKDEEFDKTFANGTSFSKGEVVALKISTGDELSIIRGGQQLVEFVRADLEMNEIEDAVSSIRKELRAKQGI